MIGFFKYLLCLLFILFLIGCEKDKDDENIIISDYNGKYSNIEFTETQIGNYPPGIYRESDIPDELKQMTFGRLEIDFNYMGGALSSFMPILYYGSVNKTDDDDLVEETQYHLVVEIGHYNVIPFPVENLFYTICYDRYPLYCRDTYVPVISGENYIFVLDKRPEGIIMQLRKGEDILNSLPSAFFPDSAQLFFKDVTQWIDHHRGDSLETIMMVGQGFVGFDKGLHTFNGQVPGIRIYRYELSDGNMRYELYGVKNQHFAGQQVNYSVRDNSVGDEYYIRMTYDFYPYLYNNGAISPFGDKQHSVLPDLPNDRSQTVKLTADDIGFYEVYLETIGEDEQVIHSTNNPFRIWVYPKAWEFEY